MNIKTEIEIITGFLCSGKTTFINALLKNTMVPKEIVIVIQLEDGSTQIEKIEKQKSKLYVKHIELSKDITTALLIQMIEFYKPHRIIIEHNGTKPLIDLLNVFDDKVLELMVKEPIIYYLSEGATFQILYNNMRELLEPYIMSSHLIMINNCSNISKQEKKSILKKLNALNPTAVILTNDNLSELEEVLKKSEVLESKLIKRIFIWMNNRQVKNHIRSR